ncbi:MAG: ATP-dependent helicase RecG, partial [Nocardioidaceae bacterium]|nr:ATP-dependent helicase RecG [Nocardioidaceae bacterium]
MITLESPVAAVLGAQTKPAKAKKIAEGLGLRTVGDLMLHFPRRYLRTGELTTVTDLTNGEMLTVVGEITQADLNSYLDRRTRRPAYRLDTTLQTDGPSLRMSFFAKSKHVSEWQAGQLEVGRKGVFVGQVGTFKGQWQLTNPQMVLFGLTDDETTGLALESVKALYPIYPLTKGVDSWDLQRAISFARTVLDEVPDPLPADLRAAHRLPDAHTALDWIHGPDSWEQVKAAQRRFRFEEALVLQLVLARRRAELAALGGQARTGGGGLLAAFDARLPFTLT